MGPKSGETANEWRGIHRKYLIRNQPKNPRRPRIQSRIPKKLHHLHSKSSENNPRK